MPLVAGAVNAAANAVNVGVNAARANTINYQEYAQDHEYEYDDGVVVMPVASRTPTHKRIRIHGGIGIRTVRWKAARQGKPPVIPKAADTPLDTLLSATVHAQLPVPLPQSGEFLFRMTGTYTYVQNEPRIAGEHSFPTGAYPFPLAPHDTLAAEYVGSSLDAFAPPTTLATHESVVAAAETAVRNGRGANFVWPLTVIPKTFAAATIQ